MILAPQVMDGKLPMNHEITYQLQDIFNLLQKTTTVAYLGLRGFQATEVECTSQELQIYFQSYSTI